MLALLTLVDTDRMDRYAPDVLRHMLNTCWTYSRAMLNKYYKAREKFNGCKQVRAIMPKLGILWTYARNRLGM